MSYNLKDIRNLRVDWQGEHITYQSASLHFESGDERFHIWLAPNTTGGLGDINDRTFNMTCTLYGNDIADGRYRDTRRMDLSKPTHKKLRELLNNAIADAGVGGLDGAVQEACRRYIAARDEAQKQHRVNLAKAIRLAIFDRGESLSDSMVQALDNATDDDLIVLRYAIIGTRYPEDESLKASGVVEL